MIMYYTPAILITWMKVYMKIIICYEYSNIFITEILICYEYSNKFITVINISTKIWNKNSR